ncbi:MAG: hydroxyacid dehydrogenase [Candidatus Sungbacteria bacterium]|uniref:Hydroxyacid dehydrogenase n=1 Tax=Candidatus Sungiibacteriota bacterium TaxID=2750080 RepID=A0A933DT58_9BACT|nr:hydroxyacid dehydrogenase [Candidatus Sungbacteria bacterium]
MSDHLIVLTEPKGYSPKAVRLLKTLGPVITWRDARKRSSLMRRATVLAVKLGIRISKRVMDALPNLKIIGTSTTGLNHIDMVEAGRRGIKVVSLRGETKFLSTIFPTAEETVGLMIMLMRNLGAGFDAVRRGRWDKERLYGHELAGKNLGIIGFGRLGSMVARFGRALGMAVIACDPNVSGRAMALAGVRKASLDKVFRRADVVSVHVLLTDKTAGLIRRRHFRLMKPTAYYINTARGELNDEAALLEALRRRRMAGAALDVLANEDPRGGHVRSHPLVRYARSRKNLIIVPHLGGATFESMAKTEEFIAGKIVRALGKPETPAGHRRYS